MDSFDLLVIGGGINGTAIARDAAGRGLEVLLVERGDLAQATSSASSKLAHGGLRYLEQYQLRLVREGLRERAILLRTAPHIVRPLRFVLPEGAGTRPWWMIRAGLALYDLFARGGGLPRARRVRASETALVAPLARPGRALTYWDGWLDDARLVVLNALDAAERGAEIATRCGLRSARRAGEVWRAELTGGRTVEAPAIVNAAGPWVAEVLGQRLSESAESRVRLVKGSHILVPALFEGDHAYILQQPDGRVVFAIAYEGGTLIGTTDVAVAEPGDAAISADEIDYLCAAANRWFGARIVAADIRWSYSGVRALYDSGEADARQVTRDYRLELDSDPGPKLLSVFGGKLTTARALAEEALAKLGVTAPRWTAHSPLPGGDLAGFGQFQAEAASRWPWLEASLLRRLTRAYGSRIERVIGDAAGMTDLGRTFGAGLTEAEIRYLVDQEWARTADDILWRRTKLGLHMTEADRAEVAAFLGA